MEGGKGNAAEVKIPASTRPVMQNIKPRNPVLLDCGVFPFDRILYFPPFPSKKNQQAAWVRVCLWTVALFYIWDEGQAFCWMRPVSFPASDFDFADYQKIKIEIGGLPWKESICGNITRFNKLTCLLKCQTKWPTCFGNQYWWKKRTGSVHTGTKPTIP